MDPVFHQWNYTKICCFFRSYSSCMRLSPETLTSSFQSSVPHSSVAVLQAPMSRREKVQYYRERFKQNKGCMKTTEKWGQVYQEQSQTWAGNLFPLLQRIPTLETNTEVRRSKVNVIKKRWLNFYQPDTETPGCKDLRGICLGFGFVKCVHGRWRPASKSGCPFERSFHPSSRSFFGMLIMILENCLDGKQMLHW